jgi:hypothetical protein
MLTFFVFIILWIGFAAISATVFTAVLRYDYESLPQVRWVRRAVLIWYTPITLIFMAATILSREDFDIFKDELQEAWDDPTYTPFQTETYL